MKTLVRLHTQFELAKVYQTFESLRLVVSEALGGSSSNTQVKESEYIESFDELSAAFAALGGKVGG